MLAAQFWCWARLQSHRSHLSIENRAPFNYCGALCRPRSPSYYSLHFNGDAARLILDAELAGAQQAQQQAPQPAGVASPDAQQQGQQGWRSHPLPSSSSSSSIGSSRSNGDGLALEGEQQQPKRVLIGHSMGGAAAAEGVISNPEGVAALVLVAPAVMALWLGPPEEAAGDAVATGALTSSSACSCGCLRLICSFRTCWGGGGGGTPSSSQAFGRSSSTASTSSSDGGSGNGSGGSGASLGARARRVVRTAVAVVKAVLLLGVRLLLAAATPLLVLVLRRLIRNRRWGPLFAPLLPAAHLLTAAPASFRLPCCCYSVAHAFWLFFLVVLQVLGARPGLRVA